MNKLLIGAVVLVVAFVGVVAFRVSSQSPPPLSNASFSTIQTDIKADAKLYDVRTSQEFAAGHFAGAQNWSLQNMQAGRLPNIEKDTKLYVYCQSGNRSSQATTLLKNAGYTNVTDLGGLQDVKALGGTLQ